jgi:hypothetical protein
MDGTGGRGISEPARGVKRTRKKTSTSRSAQKAPARASRRPSKGKKKRAQVSVASRLPAMPEEKVKAAKRKFVRGVIARGEAVPKGKPLTPGATHEIVGTDVEGEPILKRRRFSLR